VTIILNEGSSNLPSSARIIPIDYSNNIHQTILDEGSINDLPNAHDVWHLIENLDLSATTNRIALARTNATSRALRKELARQDAGVPFDAAVELQGFRIGPLLLLGAPFEIMIRYKQRIQAAFDTPTLVLSLCNDTLGYAPERTSFEKEGIYAAKVVPYLLGYPPFAPSVEDELVAELTALGQDLLADAGNM